MLEKYIKNKGIKNQIKLSDKEVTLTEVLKCLIFQGGIICLVDNDYIKDIEDTKTEDISIAVNQKGIALILKKILVIPIPEELIDYLIDNRDIIIYTFSPENYIEEQVMTIKLSRDALIEAKSIFNFSKNLNEDIFQNKPSFN